MQPTLGVACPLCGVAHAACGRATPVTPVDIPIRKEPGVGPVRKYKVTQNGFKTVMKLNDEDAKAYPGAELVDDTVAEPEPEAEAAAKTRTPADKTRRPSGNKSSN